MLGAEPFGVSFSGSPKYLCPAVGLIPFLNKASGFYSGDTPKFLEDIVDTMYFFWPRSKVLKREPDLLILLLKKDGSTAAIVVEAKYYSIKNNTDRTTEIKQNKADSENKEGIAHADGDQLAEEFYGLLHGEFILKPTIDFIRLDLFKQFDLLKEAKDWLDRSGNNKYLFYITAHYSLPYDDVKETKNSLIKLKIPEEKYQQLYWLNWQTAYEVLKKIITNSNTHQLKKYDTLIIGDLMALLRRKGLLPLAGWINLNLNDGLNVAAQKYFWDENHPDFSRINVTNIHSGETIYFWEVLGVNTC